MNGRGSAFDIYFMLAFIVIFSLIVLFATYVWLQFNTAFTAQVAAIAVTNPGVNATLISSATTPITTTLYGFDNVIVVFYFLLNIAAVISAYFVRTHPLFFVLNLFMMAFFTLGSVIFANLFYDIASTTFIAPIMVNFPVMTILFTYMPMICLVVSAVLALVMYGRPAGGGGYAY